MIQTSKNNSIYRRKNTELEAETIIFAQTTDEWQRILGLLIMKM